VHSIADDGLPGILGYVDPWSVQPGDELRCMVSSAEPSFFAQLLQYSGCGAQDPSRPGADSCWEAMDSPINGTHAGKRQPLTAGSYGLIDGRGVRVGDSRYFSLLTWVWPTRPGYGLQGLIGVSLGREYMGLGLDMSGSPCFFLGDGDSSEVTTISTSVPLVSHRWYLVGTTLDTLTGRVTVRQHPLRPYPMLEVDAEKTGRLTHDLASATIESVILGAASLEPEGNDAHRIRAPRASFDGKLDRPSVSRVNLSSGTFDTLGKGGEPRDFRSSCVAEWDLSEGIPTRHIQDVAGHGMHGKTVNTPARGVTGHNWTGEFLDWRQAPEQYGAIHFHVDDLDDAGWDTSLSFRVPHAMRSGVYAVQLTTSSCHYAIPFFVRAGSRNPKADICVLIPTFTYLAYSNFAAGAVDPVMMTGSPQTANVFDDAIDKHRELGWSLYNTHVDGSGIAYSSRRRPMLDLQPEYHDRVLGTGWTFSSDLHLIAWLNAKKIKFDVMTDEDLHRDERNALSGYKILITGSHPEYVSSAIWGAIDGYVQSGGRLMYLGGNGFYYVMNTLPDRPFVVEVRRGMSASRTWDGAPGEGCLSATGEPGGLWRHRGQAPQRLVGVGFCAQGGGDSSGYLLTAERFDGRVSRMFDGIEDGEVIGDFGGVEGSAGNELDRADSLLGTPAHALVVATSEGMHSDYYQRAIEEVLMMMPDQGGTKSQDVRADIVFFETQDRGAVFSVGSIFWSASLWHDNYANSVSRLTENVLRLFLQ
jgi:N,N-dimethylformamidase